LKNAFRPVNEPEPQPDLVLDGDTSGSGSFFNNLLDAKTGLWPRPAVC